MKAPVKTFCFVILEAAMLLITSFQMACWIFDMKREPSIFKGFMMIASVLGCVPDFNSRCIWVTINSVGYVVLIFVLTDPMIKAQIFPICSTVAADLVNTILNLDQDTYRFSTSYLLTISTVVLMAALLFASTKLNQAIKKDNEIILVKV